MSVAGMLKDYGKTVKGSATKVNVRKVAEHICCVVLGFLFSMSGFGERFSPFGISFVGGISHRYVISAGIGALCGYFFSLDSVSALRYTASTLALIVVIISLNQFKKLNERFFVTVFSTFICIFVTGLAVFLSGEADIFSFLVVFSEALVGGALCIIFKRASDVLRVKNGVYTVTSKEVTALIICVTLLLLSIRQVNIFGVYFSHIITILLILICGYYGKEAGGAIVGVCGGITMSLGDGNVMLLAFYSLGGLLTGAFSSFGKISSILAFLMSGVVVSAVSYSPEGFVPSIIEIGVAGALFLFLSIRYGYSMEKVFKPSVESPVIDSVRSNIIGKLQKAAEFSEEISTSLISVNTALAKNDRSNPEIIPKRAKDMVCGSCGLYDNCWRDSGKETAYIFDTLLELKKKGIYLEYKTVPQAFASTCIRTENISEFYNKTYTEIKMKEKTERRIQEIYTLAAEQFVNVSDLLNSICDDVNDDIRYDVDIATRVKASATECGFQVTDSCCTFNTMEKMRIELKVKKPCDKTELFKLSKQVSLITQREMESPETQENEEILRIIYKEKPEYNVVCAGERFNSAGERYSGDSFTSFTDDKGYFYALICDGMGTGTKAAVSSGLAVALFEKLIKAGFSVNSAINTVNISLISKSGEECSVTFDLFVFDMYTGRSEFYKCGAANSMVKRKGRITDVSLASLPLGIIKDTEPASGSGMLGVGDVVVLCSDGVREEDYYQVRKELKSFNKGNVRDFTRNLCEEIRKNQPSRNDDMTMITIAITNE
jgi:stage II sporulation protein E